MNPWKLWQTVKPQIVSQAELQRYGMAKLGFADWLDGLLLADRRFQLAYWGQSIQAPHCSVRDFYDV